MTKDMAKVGSSVKFERVRGLKCHGEVKEMLCNGFPPDSIARYIQEDCKEYTDITRYSLKRALIGYKNSLPEGDVIECVLPLSFGKIHEKFTSKMQELERLEGLLNALLHRFNVADVDERLTGVENPELLKNAKEIRETLRLMHTIKMDLGLVGSRDIGTITVSADRKEFIQNKYGEKAAEAFDNPVSRGRVLAALAAIRKVGGLRDKEGNRVNVSDMMEISEEEKDVIDAEYSELPPTVEEENVDGVEEAQEANSSSDVKGDVGDGGAEAELAAYKKRAEDARVKEVKRRDEPEGKKEPKMPPGPVKPGVRGK